VRLEDSRRLTGPNLYSRRPGALAEVSLLVDEDAERAVALWRSELLRLVAHVQLGPVELVARRYRGGAALFVSAPVDLLLPATDLNEWAVASAAALLDGQPPLELPSEFDPLVVELRASKSPQLHALLDAASARALPLYVDDESVSIGQGVRSSTWRRDSLPTVDEVPWGQLGRIPVGLVSGTNGKTTCARLVAHLARRAGRTPGNTSSDGVVIGESWVRRGDWTGPDAARAVLRAPTCDFAVLETARGGILRRGIAVEECDAALLTNVTDDHLGGYGVDDLETMATVKAVIARGARTVILNAEDPRLVQLAPSLSGRIVYYARSESNQVARAHRALGGETWLLVGGEGASSCIARAIGEQVTPLVEVAQLPFCYGGAARYNVDNALASAALGAALGLPWEALRDGLCTFASSASDNPGRGNLARLGEIQLLVDFGHNPAAVRAVLGLARHLAGSGRLFVTLGMPGDRPDRELDDICQELASAQPALVLLRELPDHLRGRDAGAVPALLAASLLSHGLPRDQIRLAAGERAAVDEALSLARPGDLVLVLTHLDPEVDALLVSGAPGTR
jgi:UDP-N-acetylmuramyl tripeptide synthase